MGYDVRRGGFVDGAVEADYSFFEEAGEDVVGVPAASLNS